MRCWSVNFGSTEEIRCACCWNRAHAVPLGRIPTSVTCGGVGGQGCHRLPWRLRLSSERRSRDRTGTKTALPCPHGGILGPIDFPFAACGGRGASRATASNTGQAAESAQMHALRTPNRNDGLRRAQSLRDGGALQCWRCTLMAYILDVGGARCPSRRLISMTRHSPRPCG